MIEYSKNTIFRSEKWKQNDGANILEVRGGDLEIALFLNGAPLVYDAADCEGSIGRYVAFLPYGQRLEATTLIAQAACSGFADAAPLHQQIAPLLQLLPNGRYQLTLEQVRFGYSYSAAFPSEYDFGSTWKEGAQTDVIGYYPDYGEHIRQPILTWTQPESSLEDDTINKYLSLIERGESPAMITIGAQNHAARFILDGHHKQYAYWCCGVRPRTLHIEFSSMVPIPWNLANDIVGNLEGAFKSYLKWKNRQSSD